MALKVEETLRPLKSIDVINVMSRKLINDKHIEILQIGWYASNTSIRFMVGHN